MNPAPELWLQMLLMKALSCNTYWVKRVKFNSADIIVRVCNNLGTRKTVRIQCYHIFVCNTGQILPECLIVLTTHYKYIAPQAPSTQIPKRKWIKYFPCLCLRPRNAFMHGTRMTVVTSSFLKNFRFRLSTVTRFQIFYPLWRAF